MFLHDFVKAVILSSLSLFIPVSCEHVCQPQIKITTNCASNDQNIQVKQPGPSKFGIVKKIVVIMVPTLTYEAGINQYTPVNIPFILAGV